MSPILYNVFIDDLSRELCDTNVGCFINGTCVNNLMYADDSVVLAPSPFALQRLLCICEQYAQNNEITYNVKKTVCMNVMSKLCKNIKVPSVQLYGSALKWVESHKYLGVILQNNMCDGADMRRQCRAIYAKGNLLLRKFRKCSDSVKTKLFNAYCTNLYCCHLWSNYSSRMYRDVKVAYNNTFRHLFKLPRREHVSVHYVNLNVKSFDEIVRKLIYNFKARVEGSQNYILKAIVSSVFFTYTSKIHLKWRSSIHVNIT